MLFSLSTWTAYKLSLSTSIQDCITLGLCANNVAGCIENMILGYLKCTECGTLYDDTGNCCCYLLTRYLDNDDDDREKDANK